mgnify:CR=1 FL=1
MYSAIVADRYDLAEESPDGKWAISAAGRELLEAKFGAIAGDIIGSVHEGAGAD